MLTDPPPLTTPPAKPATRALPDFVTAFAVAGATALVLAIGWALFVSRVGSREATAGAASSAVARIWGGPLLQPHPRIQWRRADAATVELAPGDIAHTDVNATLEVDYRRRGVTEFPCYGAAFDGAWTFTNPSSERAFVAFTLGLPVARDALMLQDIRLLVDGREEAGNTEYSSERIAWTGEVAGGATAQFRVRYNARGMSRFGYTFSEAATNAAGAPTHPVTGFRLALVVRGARGELDFPVGSMSPTQVDAGKDSTTLVWSVDRLLSAFDVGVELPDTHGVSAALMRLTRNAPFFYLLYAAGLIFAFRGLALRARLLHLLGLSAGYFLYFPLAVYLTAYLPWADATRISLGGVGILAIVHAWRFTDRRTTVLVALSQLFFLTVPAMAYLMPAHTGLILCFAGFAVLAVALHLVGVAARDRAAPEVVQETVLVGSEP